MRDKFAYRSRMRKLLQFDRIVQVYIAAITTYGIYLGTSSSASPQSGHTATGAALMMPSDHWTIPATLIVSGVALTIINYLVKRQMRSNVESPLIRRTNGALDWKSIQFRQIANQSFVNVEVMLDGNRYIDCTFEHCTFVYEGTAPAEIIGDNSKLIRKNPKEINFLLKSGNPIVNAAWQLQYKVAQGGRLAGMRFEPIN